MNVEPSNPLAVLYTMPVGPPGTPIVSKFVPLVL
jgi:hypothetical protein